MLGTFFFFLVLTCFGREIIDFETVDCFRIAFVGDFDE